MRPQSHPVINRRAFISGLTLAAVGTPRAVGAQQAAKVYRVGLVSMGGDPRWWQPVLDALRELGYIEGRNLAVKRAFARGRPEDLPGLVTELVRSGVDVVLATGRREIAAVRQAGPATPIVMLLVTDPVAAGFVTTLARPGGNVTGLTNLVPGFTQKYVELLREAVPSASRFAVVTSPANIQSRSELESAGKTFGIVMSITPVSGPDDFDAVLAHAKKDGASGVIAPPDPVTFLHRKRLVEGALKYRLPGIYWSREYVEEGGLMTYTADVTELRRRAATFVDRILKGAKPADLPVEQPTKFELVINLKTAKALGLTIPPSLLVRASQVIE